MRIYQSGSQVIIARESGKQIHAISTVNSAMTLYETEVAITKGENGGEIERILYTSVLDKDGNIIGTKSEVIDYLSEFISATIVASVEENPVYTIPPFNSLLSDAWGRPKSVLDKSLLHGLFTYNVPVNTWYETINEVVQSSFVNASSVNGALELVSGATLNDNTYLRTFGCPRYEPNRGHLYSTACILPSPDASGKRRWGSYTAESGVFFELDSGTLYAVVRTTVDSVTTDDRNEIDTTGIDLSKGNVYDIQFEWRGVGSYFFFINLDIKYDTKYLGTLTQLSMFNPANPISWECENNGDNVKIIAGCVDVTSEGGGDNGKTYGSIGVPNDSGQVAIAGLNVPIVAVRSKLTVGGLINTRDTLALLASAYADQRAVFRVWATRDFTAITENDQSWQDFGDGHLEYIVYDTPDVATPMTFDTAKATLVFGCRVDQDQTYSTSALFEGRTAITQYVGDMFIFTIHRETGGIANVGLTYEFCEQI